MLVKVEKENTRGAAVAEPNGRSVQLLVTIPML
jgi:hypothetical protein